MNQNETNDQDRYERAKQRVEILQGFYVHAIVFVIVNLGLAAYNLATDPDRIWFIYVLGGWGIGLDRARGLRPGLGPVPRRGLAGAQDPRGDGSRAAAFALIERNGGAGFTLTLT